MESVLKWEQAWKHPRFRASRSPPNPHPARAHRCVLRPCDPTTFQSARARKEIQFQKRPTTPHRPSAQTSLVIPAHTSLPITVSTLVPRSPLGKPSAGASEARPTAGAPSKSLAGSTRPERFGDSLFLLEPERLKFISPWQRPGAERNLWRSKPCKGETRPRGWRELPPFRASILAVVRVPRALPWADELEPFRPRGPESLATVSP